MALALRMQAYSQALEVIKKVCGDNRVRQPRFGLFLLLTPAMNRQFNASHFLVSSTWNPSGDGHRCWQGCEQTNSISLAWSSIGFLACAGSCRAVITRRADVGAQLSRDLCREERALSIHFATIQSRAESTVGSKQGTPALWVAKSGPIRLGRPPLCPPAQSKV